MSISALVLAFLAAYLLGSIPSGLLVARSLSDVDLRTVGSKNIGATNVYRVFGWKWGAAVFLADMGKGLVTALIARGLQLHAAGFCAAGVLAVLGHVYNPWLGFKGGKGVATAFGVMIGLSPGAALVALLAWAGVVAWKKLVSLASLSAAAVLPVATLAVSWGHVHVVYLTASAFVISGIVVFAHRDNIRRLRAGEEKPVGSKGGEE